MRMYIFVRVIHVTRCRINKCDGEAFHVYSAVYKLQAGSVVIHRVGVAALRDPRCRQRSVPPRRPLGQAEVKMRVNLGRSPPGCTY